MLMTIVSVFLLTVSSGLRRTESRGFDFDVEERSIAVQRLNSRLSAMSRNRSSVAKSTGISAGLSSLRSRAGSVLKPKTKGFFEQTRAMEGERGPDDP